MRGGNTGSFSSFSWCYRSTHALSRCASEKGFDVSVLGAHWLGREERSSRWLACSGERDEKGQKMRQCESRMRMCYALKDESCAGACTERRECVTGGRTARARSSVLQAAQSCSLRGRTGSKENRWWRLGSVLAKPGDYSTSKRMTSSTSASCPSSYQKFR